MGLSLATRKPLLNFSDLTVLSTALVEEI